MYSTTPIAFLALITVALAAQPSPRWTTTSASECDTDGLQCCNSVEPASSSGASSVLSGLGLLGQLAGNTPVGLTCNPISALGAGSAANCNQQPVCCENNTFNGLVNLGCSPVNLQP